MAGWRGDSLFPRNVSNPVEIFNQLTVPKASLADLGSRPDVRVRNEFPHKTTRECACMFRVLYKPGRLLICYGVEEKDKLDIMLSNPQQLKRELCYYNSAREQD